MLMRVFVFGRTAAEFFRVSASCAEELRCLLLHRCVCVLSCDMASLNGVPFIVMLLVKTMRISRLVEKYDGDAAFKMM